MSPMTLESAVVDYPLMENSVVFEIGGYTGVWSERINNKVKCNLYIFEPVTEFFNVLNSKFKHYNNIHLFNYGIGIESATRNIMVDRDASSFVSGSGKVQSADIIKIDDVIKNLYIDKIDLMQINIEGYEYDLLDHMIKNNIVIKIGNIQIQYHKNIPDCEKRRDTISEYLSKTHSRSFNYEFVFESWKIKT